MTTIDLFLDELKSEYDREFELKSSLENKANYILIAAGVTLSLLFSFGSMMVGTLTSNYEYLNLVIVSLMIGVVTNGISVLFSVLGFSIKHYGYPFPYHVFFKDDPSNNKLVFNDEVIEQYRDGLGDTGPESIQIFKESVIENYLECNKENAIQNYNKATRIKIAQWFFFAGAISIPFIVGFALPYLWTKPLL
jgi:hypothetical protein